MEALNGWLSLSTDPFKPGRAQLSANGRHSGARVKRANPESKDSPMCHSTSEVWSSGPSRNDGMRRHVSTNPVLDPLATESL
jgi:hypothetical protein